MPDDQGQCSVVPDDRGRNSASRDVAPDPGSTAWTERSAELRNEIDKPRGPDFFELLATQLRADWVVPGDWV